LDATAKKAGIQVILTTHSPVLAAAVSLETIIYLPRLSEPATRAISLKSCALTPESERFVSRWLDVTKSTLLFAKAVILVEGIAEGLLLPQLARQVLKGYNTACDAHNLKVDPAKGEKKKQRLPPTLDDAGVSIINMNGIYFRHFMPLFCAVDGTGKTHIPIRCAGITDNDPLHETVDPATEKKTKVIPLPTAPLAGTNPDLKYINLVKSSQNVRLFANQLKTFEYDLAMEGQNITSMLTVAAKLATADEKTVIAKKLTEEAEAAKDWKPDANWELRGNTSLYLLDHIEKGEFAQALAEELAKPGAPAFEVPAYIAKAVIWSCGGSDE
jgi:predicted ATP-dependent endonuclease of OLD family